jgi:hypothetical protein
MAPKIRRLGLILLLSIIVGKTSTPQVSASPSIHSCQKQVETFLASPAEQTLAAVSGPDEAACWLLIELSNDNFDRLVRSASHGNRWSAQYLAKHLRQLDGGNLEDALVALGQFSDHDMERLLMFAKSGLLSAHSLSNAMKMLPLSLSDDLPAQLKSMNARRKKVLTITREELSEQRTQALKAVDEAISEIKSNTPGLAP